MRFGFPLGLEFVPSETEAEGAETVHHECRECGQNLADSVEECPRCGGERATYTF